jgi:hypothetical protein
MVGDAESKRLKVAALNLFHPTASPLFRKAIISYCDTVSEREGNRYPPPPSRGRLGRGWGFPEYDEYAFSIMNSFLSG